MYTARELEQHYHEVTGNSLRPKTEASSAKFNLGYPSLSERAQATGENFGDYFRKSFDIIADWKRSAQTHREWYERIISARIQAAQKEKSK